MVVRRLWGGGGWIEIVEEKVRRTWGAGGEEKIVWLRRGVKEAGGRGWVEMVRWRRQGGDGGRWSFGRGGLVCVERRDGWKEEVVELWRRDGGGRSSSGRRQWCGDEQVGRRIDGRGEMLGGGDGETGS